MVRVMSLNVERSGHLDRFVPFVRQFAPDVLCLQELVESDVPAIMAGAGFRAAHFAAMARHSGAPGETPFGVGIFSHAPMQKTLSETYAGGGDGSMVLDRRTPDTRVATMRFVLASAAIAFDGFTLEIATTHFPWTPDGRPSDFQSHALDRLLALVEGRAIVLCGDFNAPRGGPVFDKLATTWRTTFRPPPRRRSIRTCIAPARWSWSSMGYSRRHTSRQAMSRCIRASATIKA